MRLLDTFFTALPFVKEEPKPLPRKTLPRLTGREQLSYQEPENFAPPAVSEPLSRETLLRLTGREQVHEREPENSAPIIEPSKPQRYIFSNLMTGFGITGLATGTLGLALLSFGIINIWNPVGWAILAGAAAVAAASALTYKATTSKTERNENAFLAGAVGVTGLGLKTVGCLG